MKLYLASDHAGFELKENLKALLPKIEWIDLGCHSTESVHYPEYAAKLAKAVIQSDLDIEEPCGVLICGSGIGVSIAANRFPEIRAALVWNEETARLSREHNRANVLCLAARFADAPQAKKLVEAWLGTKFLDGRHDLRVKMLSKVANISKVEEENL